jgi:hypothetical protein
MKARKVRKDRKIEVPDHVMQQSVAAYLKKPVADDREEREATEKRTEKAVFRAPAGKNEKQWDKSDPGQPPDSIIRKSQSKKNSR